MSEKGKNSKVHYVAKKFGIIQGEYKNTNKNISKSTPPIIEQILTGWGNLVKSHFFELEPELKKTGQKRLEICDSCDMRVGGTCSTSRQGRHVVTGEMKNGCGCRLAAKALSPRSQCPLGKW